MTEEQKTCPDCSKPLTENHVCWGQSSDFAVVVNQTDEEPEKPVKEPKPVKEKKELQKRGPKPVEDGLTNQQRWVNKNRAKFNLYQRNLMRKRRKEAKDKKAAEEAK